MLGTVLFVLTVVGSGSLVESRGHYADPRCVSRGCPADTTCRVVYRCPTPASCYLVAECLDEPPYWSQTGLCKYGDPIVIELSRGKYRDTQCGHRLRDCPNSTYCNDLLSGFYSTCCLSDPVAPVKPGKCPRNSYPFDKQDCTAYCLNDGDCLGDEKCCRAGCDSRCFHPERSDNGNTWSPTLILNDS
ncbi:waprin-Phi3 [Elysia marginata]|uniref:Waprin-Phi3 n=1 Tax=Elysia marginata TaxID=1093978 RepID=A0AAV4ENB0_9GAST|nr:waprin-Phi3 [Elysia marginata]